MRRVEARKVSAELDGEFVVFMVGMRINDVWKVRAWWPVFVAMPRMLRELYAHPEIGLLGHQQFGLTSVQDWRSYEHLEAYARSRDGAHLPAWAAFNRRARDAREAVGVWHETYRVGPGQDEAVYSGMPPFGLGKVGRLVPATGYRESARGRLRGAAEREAHERQAFTTAPDRGE